MEYYLKKKELLVKVMTSIDLKRIILNERSKTHPLNALESQFTMFLQIVNGFQAQQVGESVDHKETQGLFM